MISKNELLHVLALQRVPNLGVISAKRLLHHYETAETIFSESIDALSKIEGIGAFRFRQFNPALLLDEAKQELEFIRANGIECLYFKDENYPDFLGHCYDAPILLFKKGTVNLKNKPVISIVGTRAASHYGREFCDRLVRSISSYDPIVVSGLAYGIDIAAHKAALKYNVPTVACLAHGFEQVYPKIHERYARDITERGALLSEFWSTDTFDRNNFLKRNRIIAGLSQATIVVESAEKGGSLVTADIANSYNREVFAVPGKVTDPMSQGCNQLIKTNGAHLLTDPEELAEILGWNKEASITRTIQKQLFVELTTEEKQVFKFLEKGVKKELDLLSAECGLPTYKVASILLGLELKGVIRPLPGKLFQAV